MDIKQLDQLAQEGITGTYEFRFDFTQKMRVRGRIKTQNYRTKVTLTLKKANKILDEYGVKLVFIDPTKVV